MSEAGQHRRLDVAALDRLALDQGAAEALEGEDHRQRHEDQRHHRLAEADRRDQAGQDDGGGEGDHFDADAGGRRPADAGDGGLLELLGGELFLGQVLVVHPLDKRPLCLATCAASRLTPASFVD